MALVHSIPECPEIPAWLLAAAHGNNHIGNVVQQLTPVLGQLGHETLHCAWFKLGNASGQLTFIRYGLVHGLNLSVMK